ncbi:MAG: ATP-binding protein [Pirellulales bacterium]|nr:ATP-binding protein [Pirellulales bacterium]
MIVAIASGKGGTGKTTVAVNLAYLAARSGRATAYLDCDVEEPDGHVFLRPEIEEQQPIEKLVPTVDPERCTYCGACARVCRFGAIASLPKQTVIFSELCHACGGCRLACPVDAIREVPRTIGILRRGHSGEIRFLEGVLNVGEAMSPPAIRAVKAAAPKDAELILLDAPPGTSCPAVETVRGCDYVVLVTEPTPFGLNDLVLAVEMVRALRRPFGVVVNRADVGNGRVREYCAGQRIPMLGEIPDDRAAAEAYSRGQMLVEAVDGFAERFGSLLARLVERKA